MEEDRKYCFHCKEFLNQRTYRRHVSLYYNRTTKIWKRDRTLFNSDDSDTSEEYDNSSFENLGCTPLSLSHDDSEHWEASDQYFQEDDTNRPSHDQHSQGKSLYSPSKYQL